MDTMGYDDFRPYFSVIMLITFIALFFWVLSPKRKKDFDEAANLPFADDDQHEPQDMSNPARERKNND